MIKQTGYGSKNMVVFILWMNTYTTLRDFEMHGTLWRTIKVTATKGQLKSLQEIERDYIADPRRMQQLVAEAELKQRQILEARENQAKAEQEAESWKKVAGDTLKTNKPVKNIFKAPKRQK